MDTPRHAATLGPLSAELWLDGLERYISRTRSLAALAACTGDDRLTAARAELDALAALSGRLPPPCGERVAARVHCLRRMLAEVRAELRGLVDPAFEPAAPRILEARDAEPPRLRDDAGADPG